MKVFELVGIHCESDSESREKVISDMHSVHTHLSKDKNYEICMKTKRSRTPFRKRTDTVVSRADGKEFRKVSRVV